MRKKRIVGGGLVILSVCLASLAAPAVGNYRPTYPKSAEDIVALAETVSRVDYSVNDAIKQFGAVNRANRDDEVSLNDFAILLTPLASARNDLKRVVLYTFHNERETKPALEAVKFDYLKTIQISYGELIRKYGAPAALPLPRVKCAPGVNCHPAFIGYRFSYVPQTGGPGSGKRLEVQINLEMEWSKVLPRHTDADFMAVKSVRFKRIWRT